MMEQRTTLIRLAQHETIRATLGALTALERLEALTEQPIIQTHSERQETIKATLGLQTLLAQLAVRMDPRATLTLSALCAVINRIYPNITLTL